MRISDCLRWIVLTLLVLLVGCRGDDTTATPPPATSAPTTQPADAAGGGRGLMAPEPTPGITLRLSDAAPAADQPVEVPPAAATPLSAERVATLLERVPPLPESAAQPTEFALREGPQPPAITGETIEQPFPPPATPEADAPAVDAGPLEVLRRQPEGAVEIASHLAVTFSAPMVPLTSHAALADEVPVQLEPQPAGQWRWVGSRTLLFEPDGDRFPMATRYQITVPADVTSAAGAPLGTAVEWTFTTPPPSVVEMHPQGGPTERQPVLFLRFDQRVAPEAVLEHATLSADGSTVALRLATEDEVAADDDVRRRADQALDGRWTALRPAAPLPRGAAVELVVGPELPSAEGPRASEGRERFTFEVYRPLEVVEIACATEEEYQERDPDQRLDGCVPLQGWSIWFNNPLVASSVTADDVTVEPELPGMRVDVRGDQLVISGQSRGRTDYTVTVPAAVRDTFGQTLGQAVTVRVRTGDARPALFGPEREIVVLDPSGPPALEVFAINNPALEVSLYRIDPDDPWTAWTAYQEWQRRRFGEDPARRPAPPGEEAWSGRVRPEGERDALTRVPIDLSPALDGEHGQVVVEITPEGWDPEEPEWQNRPVATWVQVTDLGLDAFVDHAAALTWVTALTDGQPVEGAEVLLAPDVSATTDGQGLAELAFSGATADAETDEARAAARTDDVRPPVPANPSALVVARRGDDWAVLPGGYDRWERSPRQEMLRWYTFDDRALYKPNETARVKGWVRRYDPGKGGDVSALDGGPGRVGYTLVASNGQEIGSGTADVSALGGFDITLEIPADVELGPAQLQLTAEDGPLPADGRNHSHQLQIAEFRRPEFEVTATAGAPTHMLGDDIAVTAEAGYFGGGALPGAEVTWRVHAEPTSFTPPDHDDFEFGTWQPWWGWFIGPSGTPSTVEEHVGRTDASGQHRLGVAVERIAPPAPASLRAEATVMDVNRQAWTGTAALLVHPADEYVGLRLDRWFVEPGQPLTVEAVVPDIDGQRIVGREIALVAERVEWQYGGDEPTEERLPAGECTLTSAEEPTSCTLELETAGRHEITATIVDDAGRRNRTRMTVWVGGGPTPTRRGVASEEIQLIPDAEEYQPGDTAEILVQAPFAPAEVLVTVRRSGLVRHERHTLTDGTTTLQVPITEDHLPNVHIQVDAVGSATREDDRDLPPRPALASGALDLPVPPLARTLTVEPAPADDALAPGATTTIDITVRDADDAPLADAEVALVVVDEAVLSLTDYEIPDPIEAFYPHRPPGVSDHHQRTLLALADPAALLEERGLGRAESMLRSASGDLMMMADGAEAMPMAAMSAVPMDEAAEQGAPARTGGGAQAAPTVTERTDLNPLAAFVPALRTDSNGRATAEVTLPDSVTRYRVTAVATDGARQFGKGEATITARLPLVVRPSAPRFLNFGDQFQLPVVVQNQTDDDLAVEVVLRTANLALTEGAGRRTTIPAGNRVEVRFPAAAELPGTAAFQAAAFSEDAADAQRVTLPVWSPATTEAFATYGELDSGAVAQPVARPPDVVTGFGGLELTTSSTALSQLTDAFLYLQSYPYEGAEQVASRLVATVALADVLTAFGGQDVPSREEIDSAVARDIERLAALQNSDGGFGWWSAGQGSSPFASVHVAHALVRAAVKDYAVDEATMERTLGYLREIERHLDRARYSERARTTITAYALYTRALQGDIDADAARALYERADDPPVEAMGWLLSVLTDDPASADTVDEILRQINNRVAEEAGTAQITTRYDEEAAALTLASRRRADAVVLEALIAVRPESDLIPKLTRGLLAHRTRGRWSTTQENAFVLLALDRYFRTYEDQTPDFTARAWLGSGFIGAAEFVGRSADRQHVEAPLTALPAEGTADVVLGKEGQGRLYYRLGLRYAPDDLVLEPSEHGFSVARRYEAVDDPDDVRRRADGGWEVRAGARVRVVLELVAPARRYHVALVDPLPAGLEALNPELATTGTLPPDEPSTARRWPWWFGWRWYDHDAFRDERTEAFARLLPAGVYRYSYIARATTPGTFVVPPTRAEELYHPETFGRAGTDQLIVR